MTPLWEVGLLTQQEITNPKGTHLLTHKELKATYPHIKITTKHTKAINELAMNMGCTRDIINDNTFSAWTIPPHLRMESRPNPIAALFNKPRQPNRGPALEINLSQTNTRFKRKRNNNTSNHKLVPSSPTRKTYTHISATRTVLTADGTHQKQWETHWETNSAEHQPEVTWEPRESFDTNPDDFLTDHRTPKPQLSSAYLHIPPHKQYPLVGRRVHTTLYNETGTRIESGTLLRNQNKRSMAPYTVRYDNPLESDEDTDMLPSQDTEEDLHLDPVTNTSVEGSSDKDRTHIRTNLDKLAIKLEKTHPDEDVTATDRWIIRNAHSRKSKKESAKSMTLMVYGEATLKKKG